MPVTGYARPESPGRVHERTAVRCRNNETPGRHNCRLNPMGIHQHLSLFLKLRIFMRALFCPSVSLLHWLQITREDTTGCLIAFGLL